MSASRQAWLVTVWELKDGVQQAFSGLGLISGAANAGASLEKGGSNSSTEVMFCTSWMGLSFRMPA